MQGAAFYQIVKHFLLPALLQTCLFSGKFLIRMMFLLKESGEIPQRYLPFLKKFNG